MTLITDDMKTEFFPASVKPVRKGMYEVWRWTAGRERKMRPHYLNWSCETGWTYAHEFETASKGDFAAMLSRDGDCWRGLTDEGRSYASAMGLYGDGETS